MSVMVLILGALERFGIASCTEVFEIGGKYRGLGFVKQLIGGDKKIGAHFAKGLDK